MNVASGTYAENVVVSKSLDIRGANYGVAGNGTRGSESIVSGNSGTGVQVQAINVVFDGFEVSGHDAGVSIAPAIPGNLTGAKVRNNRVHDVDGAGIAAGAAYDGTLRAQTGLEIADNEVYNTEGPAVQLRGITAASDSLRVWRNILRNAPVALWLDDARLVSVKANELRDAATTGLHVTSGNAAAVPDDVVIINNLFVDNAKGLFVEAMAADGLLVNSNSFTGSGTHIDHDDADLLAATCNWLGSDVPATVQGTVQGTVSFIPWLIDGADGSASIGFQPVGACAGYPVTLQVKAMLQGAYVEADGLMRDNLRSGGLIPATQPYTALGFSNVEGSAHTANMNTTGANAIVDWVLLELRSVPVPNNAASANQVVKRRAALIQRDGDIVDLDGVSPIRLWDMERDFYYVAVRHRNHLGAMTNTSMYMGADPSLSAVDFTTAATFGTNAQRQMAVGVAALWSGNTRLDGVLKYTGPSNDRDPILMALPAPSASSVRTNVYHNADVNLDGMVKYTGSANDRDPILVNIGGYSPTAVRIQRLP